MKRTLGKIHFKDKEITGFPPHKIAQMGMGLVLQGRRVFPSLSVRENLTMAMRNVGKRGAWSLDRVYSVLPILKERSHFRGTLLRGGEQQILAIGRALMTNSDLLLMDEPSEGLAPMMIREISRIISDLKKSGVSVLLVEQNLPMALSLADYVYIVSRGKIVHEPKPEELEKDEEIKDTHLGISRYQKGRVVKSSSDFGWRTFRDDLFKDRILGP